MLEPIFYKSRFSGAQLSQSEYLKEEIDNFRKNILVLPQDKRFDFIIKKSKPFLAEANTLKSKRKRTETENRQLVLCTSLLNFFSEQAELYSESAINNELLINEVTTDNPKTANPKKSIQQQLINKPLSKKEACNFIGISMPKLNLYIKEGYLSQVTVGRRKFITPKAIQKFLEENEYISGKPLKIKKSNI